MKRDTPVCTSPRSGGITSPANATSQPGAEPANRQDQTDLREEIYRTLAELSSELIFWISADRRTIHFISDHCEDFTGYRQEEFYQDAGLLDRILHPDYRDLWLKHTSTAAQGKGAEPAELALIRRRGETVWVSHICRPVWDEAGSFRGIRGRFIDITHLKESDLARRASEEELRLQNSYLRALHETTLGLIGRLELHGLLSAIISRAAELMNTSHGFIYLLNDDRTSMELRVGLGQFENQGQRPLRRGDGFAGHVWEQGAACTTTDVQKWGCASAVLGDTALKAAAAVPLTSDGEICGIIGLSYDANGETFDSRKVGVMQQFAELASLALDNARLYDSAKRDLHERSKAEEQLRKLSHAVMQSPVSIIITDIHGTIEFANPHVARLTGYEPEELLGKNPSIFKSGLTCTEKYRNLWDTILGGGEWRGELQNRKKNGQLYWQRALISPVRDQNGVITHFMAINEDISDLKIMENQLRHAQKMEAIGQLAGGIAHDFNNILTAIIGYGNILTMKVPAGSPLCSTAEQILAAAERGANLTKGLLTFSRKQTSTLLRVDLNGIIERIEKLLLSLLGDSIKVTTHLSQEPLPISADSMQMEQVLINLATNARDILPEGGSITISTELSVLDNDFATTHGIGPGGRYALLTVCDTGGGMDEETIKRIFDPFYTTKESGKGTGLGLSIVYGIVRKHNGNILCSSTPGEGTVFRIYLPLLEEKTAQRPQPEVHQSATRSVTASIILTAADEDGRCVTRQLLEEFGYAVMEATDAGMVVQKCRDLQGSVSLVILDDMCGDARGLKTLREIRAAAPGIPVVLCAAPQDNGIKQLLMLGPGIELLSKPFTPKELLMKIREVAQDAV